MHISSFLGRWAAHPDAATETHHKSSSSCSLFIKLTTLLVGPPKRMGDRRHSHPYYLSC